MRHNFVPISVLAALLAGCTGQVRLNTGATGPAIPAGSAVTLIGTAKNDHLLVAQAQKEVLAALASRGHSAGSGGAARIEVGLSDRLATTGIGVLEGPELSAAKKKKFLQTCKDRTYRLVLTYYGAGADVPVTRAWAEERHCKGPIDASIAALAERAVASLAIGSSSESGTRPGAD